MATSSTQSLLDLTLTSDMISNAVKSFTMSKRITQAFVKASILNILYQRMVLNEADLKTREVEGTPIKVFKRKHLKDPLLKQCVVWMNGIVDAIDKNYLKEAFLFMKNVANDEVVEMYKFSLKYNQEKKEEYQSTPSYVKLAIDEFLRAINHLGQYKKLDEKTEVQIELTYFEETPKRYEPPGFQASFNKYCILATYCNVHLGTLKTGYHKLTCHGGGKIFKEQPLPVEIVEVAESENAVENEKNPFDQSTVEDVSINIEDIEDTVPEVVPDALNISGITVSDFADRDRASVTSDDGLTAEQPRTCLCELTIPLKAEMVDCQDCQKAYHAPCHGHFSKEEALRAGFSCIQCNNTDYMMGEISSSDRTLFCRTRLVLYYLDKHGQLPMDVLNMMSENHRNKVIGQLEYSNIISGRKAKKVNQIALRRAIQKFFIMDDSQML